MRQYLELLRHTVEHGRPRADRTGVGTIGTFGWQMRFDLRAGFPLLTTKKLHTKSIFHELLWFIAGRTDNAYLQERGVSIWNEWATAEQCARFGRVAGDLGPIYGHQWRNFGATRLPDGTYARDGKDQLAWVLAEIRRNPGSRRLIVSGWNAQEADQVALPPCHTMFQFYVQDGELSCQLYQRSADIFLGVPFNIASYALLTHMLAQQCDLGVGDLVWTGGDCHLYLNHLEQADLQMARTPYPLPTLKFRRRPPSLFDYSFEDFEIIDYRSHAAIKAPIAV